MKQKSGAKRVLLTCCAAALWIVGQAAQAATELTVYTAVEAEDLARYAETFNQDHPDIEIKWVRDSTGIVTAKLLAEKNNPQADVIWGLAATSLLLMKSEGMLEPYKPKGVEKLDKKFVDSGAVPTWVGMDAWVASVCYNTVEAAKHNLKPPKTWKDLLDPMQMFGKDKGGWEFMDGLHKNIARYTHSGSKPCKLAAAGEIPIGISFAFRGAKSKAAGAPLEIIVPDEGVGWDMEATAIVAGTSKLKAAQTLVDWSITRKANEMYNTGYAVVAMPGVAKPVEHFPENLLEKMIDNDFEWAANNRKAILAEWLRRYDSKSEAK